MDCCVELALMYAAAVFSACVQASVQVSALPDASTPSGKFPEEQFVPLAARADGVGVEVAMSLPAGSIAVSVPAGFASEVKYALPVVVALVVDALVANNDEKTL